jgi:hypothetical protein
MAGFDYDEMLQKRKELWRKQEDDLKSEISSLDLQIRNLNPNTEKYKILSAQKLALEQRLYTDKEDNRERFEYLLSKVKEQYEKDKEEQEEREEKRKERLETAKNFIHKIPLLGAAVMAGEKAYHFADVTRRGLKSLGQMQRKTTNFALEKILTKKTGRGREGRFQFGDLSRFAEYSKDYQKLDGEAWIKGGKLYDEVKNLITGEVEGVREYNLAEAQTTLDYINQKRDEGMSKEEILTRFEDLIESGVKVNEEALNILKKDIEVPEIKSSRPESQAVGKPQSIPTQIQQAPVLTSQDALIQLSMSEEERKKFFSNPNAVKQAKNIDAQNKIVLEDSLVDFYEQVTRMQKAEMKKKSKPTSNILGGLKNLSRGIGKIGSKGFGIAKFLLGSKVGLALFASILGGVMIFGPTIKEKFLNWWNKKDTKELEPNETKEEKDIQVIVDSEGKKLDNDLQKQVRELAEKSDQSEAEVLTQIETESEKREKELEPITKDTEHPERLNFETGELEPVKANKEERKADIQRDVAKDLIEKVEEQQKQQKVEKVDLSKFEEKLERVNFDRNTLEEVKDVKLSKMYGVDQKQQISKLTNTKKQGEVINQIEKSLKKPASQKEGNVKTAEKVTPKTTKMEYEFNLQDDTNSEVKKKILERLEAERARLKQLKLTHAAKAKARAQQVKTSIDNNLGEAGLDVTNKALRAD